MKWSATEPEIVGMIQESELPSEDQLCAPSDCSKIWTQRNGKTIKISQMSDRHLVNTFRLIERKRTTDQYSITGFCIILSEYGTIVREIRKRLTKKQTMPKPKSTKNVFQVLATMRKRIFRIE